MKVLAALQITIKTDQNLEFLKKQWNHPSNDDLEKAKHLSDELRMHPLVADILLSRGFKKDWISF